MINWSCLYAGQVINTSLLGSLRSRHPHQLRTNIIHKQLYDYIGFTMGLLCTTAILSGFSFHNLDQKDHGTSQLIKSLQIVLQLCNQSVLLPQDGSKAATLSVLPVTVEASSIDSGSSLNRSHEQTGNTQRSQKVSDWLCNLFSGIWPNASERNAISVSVQFVWTWRTSMIDL